MLIRYWLVRPGWSTSWIAAENTAVITFKEVTINSIKEVTINSINSIMRIRWITSSGVKTDSKAGELSKVFMERVTSAAWLLLWYGTCREIHFCIYIFLIMVYHLSQVVLF